jgi:transketolase
MLLDELRQFKAKSLNNEQADSLNHLADKVRMDVLTMTSRAGSGHVGGALSSLDIYLMLWLGCNVSPKETADPNRDRIIVSHGHTSAAVYATLGNLGYFDLQEAMTGFRKSGSVFEGHPRCSVPGVEWCSGSLGQGLSVGCGMAMAGRMQKRDFHVFVVMGDGEQEKGQIAEARTWAAKYRLNRLTAIIDANGLQASGSLVEVMPMNLAETYSAAGWNVLTVDGHDYRQLYQVLKSCYGGRDRPTVVLAKTVMGKGVPFIENNYEFHGKVLSEKELSQAQKTLGEFRRAERSLCNLTEQKKEQPIEWYVPETKSRTYLADKKYDCRSAAGEALVDIVEACQNANKVPVAVLDCDLAKSVRTDNIKERYPNCFVECGIEEHHTATLAGAMSKTGVLTFWSEFGVFGIDEVYSQHRMNDFNSTSVKIICTHNGLDVGEDGKTHQCIDYLSLLIPADANQADRMVRLMAKTPGNFVLATGRSAVSIITDENDEPIFGNDYKFVYGRADWIRRGPDGTIVTCGTLVERAVAATKELKQQNLSLGVLNISSPMELDHEAIQDAVKTGFIVTYEDHNVRTGLGSIVAGFLMDAGVRCKFKRLGINRYGDSGDPESQYRNQGLDVKSLVETVKRMAVC